MYQLRFKESDRIFISTEQFCELMQVIPTFQLSFLTYKKINP